MFRPSFTLCYILQASGATFCGVLRGNLREFSEFVHCFNERSWCLCSCKYHEIAAFFWFFQWFALLRDSVSGE